MSFLTQQKNFNISLNNNSMTYLLQQQEQYEKLLKDLANYENEDYYFLKLAEKKYYYALNKDNFKILDINNKENNEDESEYKNYKFEKLDDFVAFLFKIYDIDTDLFIENKKEVLKDINKSLAKQYPVKFVFNPFLENGLIKGNGFLLLNNFKKTKYMEIADNIKKRHTHLTEKEFKKAFPHFSTLLLNVCEDDYNNVKLVLNYFADLVQNREKTNVIFVFRSIQGAGKGLLLDSILRELLHTKQVHIKKLEDLNKRFNADLAESLLLAIDESQHDAKKTGQVSEKIKQMAANSVIELEKKHLDSMQVKTHFNFLVFTNNFDGIKIEPDDRRYYVFASTKNIDVVFKNKFKEELKEFGGSVKKFIKAKFFGTEEADRFLTYISTLEVNEDYSRAAKLINSAKMNMIFSTNNLLEIFTKIIARKHQKVLQFLYKKLESINEENEFENANNDENKFKSAYPTFKKEELDLFFAEVIEKGKVRKSLMHKIIAVFLSQKEKIYADKRISTELEKHFPVKKDSKGIRKYVVGSQAEFYFDEFINAMNEEENFSEIFEESFSLNELDNLLVEASNI